MSDYFDYDGHMIMITPSMGGIFFVWMPDQ